MRGLTVRYELARRALFEHLRNDPITLVLELNSLEDLQVQDAVRDWVAEYAN